jgi:hypothetical protein
VYIVDPVTVDTCPGGRFDHLDGLAVTAVTVNALMFAIQFELGLGIVIEAPDLPAIWGMAAVTIQTQFAMVAVISFMAGITLN